MVLDRPHRGTYSFMSQFKSDSKGEERSGARTSSWARNLCPKLTALLSIKSEKYMKCEELNQEVMEIPSFRFLGYCWSRTLQFDAPILLPSGTRMHCRKYLLICAHSQSISCIQYGSPALGICVDMKSTQFWLEQLVCLQMFYRQLSEICVCYRFLTSQEKSRIEIFRNGTKNYENTDQISLVCVLQIK